MLPIYDILSSSRFFKDKNLRKNLLDTLKNILERKNINDFENKLNKTYSELFNEYKDILYRLSIELKNILSKASKKSVLEYALKLDRSLKYFDKSLSSEISTKDIEKLLDVKEDIFELRSFIEKVDRTSEYFYKMLITVSFLLAIPIIVKILRKYKFFK